MTGVIDNEGIQWERCNQCGGWENINELSFGPINPALPRPEWAVGNKVNMDIDLCRQCVAGIPWEGKYRD